MRVVRPYIETVIMHLEKDALKITEWFPNSFMKLNADKCHLMIFGAKGNNEISITIDVARVKECTEENLLGITFDQSFSFKQHVRALCKKAAQKIHAFARISRCMETEKLQQLTRAFVLSQFSYCPLVWMFYDRTLDHRINRTQERALRISYKDYGNDFGFLLEQTKSIPIHVRILQFLMTEMYKTKFVLKPPFMKKIFLERNISYNLRRGNNAQLPKVRTTSFGIESITYLGNKLWHLLPLEIKQSNTLPIFNGQITCWKGDKCSCRLCKTYIPKVGFLTG